MLDNSVSKESKFHGPLFVVGMPRSGTKLLRALLIRNSNINIPPSETNFIPYMIDRFGKTFEFADLSILKDFYTEFTKTSFYGTMKKKGVTLEFDKLKTAEISSWSELIEYLLRYYTYDPTTEDFILGDKSPAYVNHMIMLKETFPAAKFLHIIRDPRDYALSVKKTWGKNIYRAASKWNASMNSVQLIISNLGDDYMELHFEELLDRPKIIMLEICDFIGCEFSDDMIKLSEPSEFIGSSKGETRIVKGNKNKYLTELSTRQINRIEEIVFRSISSMQYEIKYASQSKPIGKIMLRLYKILDGLALIKFYTGSRGFLQGLRYTYQGYRRSLRI